MEGLTMLIAATSTTIYFYKQPIDFRQAINGITFLIHDGLKRDPQSGDYYLFTNKSRNKIKCLYWHHNGFVLLNKRLEKGRLPISEQMNEDEITLTQEQLELLLMGFDFYLYDENGFQKFEFYR
jgi:transposase